MLFFGGQDGYLYSLFLENGKLSNKWFLDGKVYSSPVVDSAVSTLYIGSYNQQLYAFDLSRNATIKWTFKTDGTWFYHHNESIIDCIPRTNFCYTRIKCRWKNNLYYFVGWLSICCKYCWWKNKVEIHYAIKYLFKSRSEFSKWSYLLWRHGLECLCYCFGWKSCLAIQSRSCCVCFSFHFTWWGYNYNRCFRLAALCFSSIKTVSNYWLVICKMIA